MIRPRGQGRVGVEGRGLYLPGVHMQRKALHDVHPQLSVLIQLRPTVTDFADALDVRS